MFKHFFAAGPLKRKQNGANNSVYQQDLQQRKVPVGPNYNKWLIILVVPKAVSEPKLPWSWVFIVGVNASIHRSLMFMRNIFFVPLALRSRYFRMLLWNCIRVGFVGILLDPLLPQFVNFFPLAGSLGSVVCYVFLRFKIIVSVKGVCIF